MNRKTTEPMDEPEDKTPTNPEYEFYKLYQEYFENHQKLMFDFWSQAIKNVWWYSNKDK